MERGELVWEINWLAQIMIRNSGQRRSLQIDVIVFC
jgi:hypothetical protein